MPGCWIYRTRCLTHGTSTVKPTPNNHLPKTTEIPRILPKNTERQQEPPRLSKSVAAAETPMPGQRLKVKTA